MKYLSALLFGCGLIPLATPAFAIPSPELVIGSVSSLSQLFAVGFAMVSGTMAAMGAKFGIRRKSGSFQSVFSTVAVIILLVLCMGSITFNFYQVAQSNTEQLLKMQKTLVRPAQFSGTKILDESLKETSFRNQSKSSLGISTSEVAAILDGDKNAQKTLFFDVRERAENMMGTLPGAQHIRFPDIATAGLNLEGNKVVLLCHNGNRSSETCARLAAMGIDCRFITGGLEKWIVEGRTFTDSNVRKLSDLRAIPDYKNKETLISTPQFENHVLDSDIQIVDTRYPKDFAAGHLPNAINIPLRAMPTDKLKTALGALQNKPTVVACYDRRSCFMGQVLGYEMAARGIDYLGRYTTPWDYFIAPPPKPHVQEWLLEQDKTLWDRAIEMLADGLLSIADKSHFLIGILALSLLSRIIILPIALKSEKDQIAMAQNKQALADLKSKLKHDPIRRARAVQNFHKKLGLTPLRNLTALLFLPVMMLGLNAIEKAAPKVTDGFLWIATLGNPDPYYILPLSFGFFAGVYLHVTLASSNIRRLLSWGIAVPLLIALVLQLSAAGTLYLNVSLILLLVQRFYVTKAMEKTSMRLRSLWHNWKIRNIHKGIIPLGYSDALTECGNKSHRLSVLLNSDFLVPNGVVIEHTIHENYATWTSQERIKFFDQLWRMVDKKPCVVRSSGSDEDGEGQSFAGVFDSVLDIDRTTIQAGFETVLKSFQSKRAGSYQNQSGFTHRGNILVQQMIDAEYSGVLFTQDPMAPGQMLVEMAKGTADDLVSGRVTPLSLRFGRFTHKKCDDTDTPIDLAELIQIGQQVESLFGKPQDIEWAYLKGRFYLVQSRDITTLNLGSKVEQARQSQWCGFFDRFGDGPKDGLILKQDEMSEVLPRPTPLSFSIMSSLWAPGGSVELACRELGLKYPMPENINGHMYQLFGKVYSDVALKSEVALFFSKSMDKSLNTQCHDVEQKFKNDLLPPLVKKLAYWNATDLKKLTFTQKIEFIGTVSDYFRQEVYVVAEKINILASILGHKAALECADIGLDALQITSAPATYSPNNIISLASNLPENKRKEYLLSAMGHRAIFDYELSTPRYNEAPEMLWKLSQIYVKPLNFIKKDSIQAPPNLSETMQLSMQFQGLKEQAKHEALRVYEILRTALLEIDNEFGNEGLIFYLQLDEVLNCTEKQVPHLKNIATNRLDKSKLIKQYAPEKATLSLHDCELLSNLSQNIKSKDGEMQGSFVSGGQDVCGSIFIASEQQELGLEELSNFNSGDILVCKMVNPAWLPYVLQSTAVVSEVGGWLSHMAIVAREHNIPMIVGCSGLNQFRSGMEIKITKSGLIEVQTPSVLGIAIGAE